MRTMAVSWMAVFILAGALGIGCELGSSSPGPCGGDAAGNPLCTSYVSGKDSVVDSEGTDTTTSSDNGPQEDSGDGSVAVDKDAFDVTSDIVGGPRLLVSPEFLFFGAVEAGSQQSKLVTILNVGTADLEVRQFTLTGSPAFSVAFNGQDYPLSDGTVAGIAL